RERTAVMTFVRRWAGAPASVRLCAAVLHGPTGLEAAEKCSDGCKAANVLACRMANYGKFQSAAWPHLPSIGFKHVFMNVMPPGEVEATKKLLAEHGLKIAVIRGDTDLSRPTSVDELAVQLETCERLGVRYMFLSPKHSEVSKEVACERLRRAGDVARRHGVTIALETHPDLGTNGDVHVETMKRINHPNIRVNFDTGNVTFYNHDTDAAAELAKCIKYVATVEFKDHNGEFKTWNFPTVGKGIVDFQAVMKVLAEHDCAGPITMEVEGVTGVEMDEAQTKKYVEESAAYVRSLGKFD
ncbi:MAG: sugar phosphate isomerase/epimerase family protein, partial [Planctomycetota bacterium]